MRYENRHLLRLTWGYFFRLGNCLDFRYHKSIMATGGSMTCARSVRWKKVYLCSPGQWIAVLSFYKCHWFCGTDFRLLVIRTATFLNSLYERASLHPDWDMRKCKLIMYSFWSVHCSSLTRNIAITYYFYKVRGNKEILSCTLLIMLFQKKQRL